MFADPDLIKEQKDNIMPLGSYIYKLHNLVLQTSQRRNSLRDSIPEQFTSLKEDGIYLINQHRALADNIQNKIDDYIDLNQNAINKLFEDYRKSVTSQINAYKDQMDINLGFLLDEVNNRYYITSLLDDITNMSDIESKCKEGDAEQLFKDIETLCRRDLMEKDTIDDYCTLLLNKFATQGGIDVDLTYLKKGSDHPAIVDKFNNLVGSCKDQIDDIKKWISSNLIVPLQVNDISKGINFEKFRRSVSQDGYSGFLEFDLTYQGSLGLVDKILCPKDNGFSCLTAISNNFIAAGCQDGKISLYRTEDGNHLGMLPGHNATVSAICWMKDKQGLPVVCSGANDSDSSILVTSLALRKTVADLKPGHSCGVSALLGLEDGRTLFSGGQDGAICLWDLCTNRLVHKEFGHRLAITCLRICEKNDDIEVEEGKMTKSNSDYVDVLLSGGRDNQICIWELERGNDNHGANIMSIKFKYRIERNYPITNIIPRQALRGTQIIVVQKSGLIIEVIDIDKLHVEESITKPYPDQNYVVLEHTYKEGRFDFSIISTVMPSDEEYQRNMSSSDTGDNTLQMYVAPFMPRAQLINHNKNRLRVAKISGINSNSNAINIYDIMAKATYGNHQSNRRF
jgi:WD40 repeat protein